MSQTTTTLLKEIRQCRACIPHLALGPRPVVNFSARSKILLVGQAPGAKVHASGIPWDDASGERLRAWFQIEKTTFYDPNVLAIVPMGFCYPGRGKSGDLPPRGECAELWMEKVRAHLKELKLAILIGQYAQNYFLGAKRKKTLTQTVQAWQEYSPHYIVLPHPSPRNNIWLKKNPWFEADVLPSLRNTLKQALA